MPRYHFNVHDGVSLPDRDGVELPNLPAARKEAVRYAIRSQHWVGQREIPGFQAQTWV